MLSLYENQINSTNAMEFRVKKLQLQRSMIEEVLTDPSNCACIFAGANPFPAAPTSPGADLVSPSTATSLGRYKFITAGDCSTATLPNPLISSAGIDGLILSSIQLTKINQISGTSYSGELLIDIASSKKVLGPPNLKIKIPVSVAATPAGAGTVNFQSCSMTGSTPVVNTPNSFANPAYNQVFNTNPWRNVFLVNNIACKSSQATILWGAQYEGTGDDSYGTARLSVNGTAVSTIGAGVKDGGGNQITNYYAPMSSAVSNVACSGQMQISFDMVRQFNTFRIKSPWFVVIWQ